MYEIDKDRFRKIMVDEQGYTANKVDQLLADYPAVDDRFAEAIEQWLEDRTIADVSVDGLSLKEVIDNRRFHFLVAVRTLNELLEKELPEPDRSRQVEALRTPVYFE